MKAVAMRLASREGNVSDIVTAASASRTRAADGASWTLHVHFFNIEVFYSILLKLF